MKSCLLLLCLAAYCPAADARALPLAYPELPESAYTPLSRDSISLDGAEFSVRVAPDRTLHFAASRQSRHPNGDFTVAGLDESGNRMTATVGPDGAFGRLHMAGRDYVLTTDKNGAWLIELPTSGVSYNSCGLHAPAPAQFLNGAGPSTEAVNDPLDQVIDILLIYNQAMAERYPGALLETRLNHFIAIGNQTLANSEISLGLRVVGMDFFNYRNDNSNFDLRNDIATALGGATVRGLEGLGLRRDTLGADLVIMVRPHAIELRGSCGIAFFPDNDPRLGANVVSDGMSSWSACLDDVLIHEIGHNLGAGHQVGAGGAFYDPRGSAFVNPGQYSTVMGSFGTGRPDRFRGLPVFSNPDVLCGGQLCGSNAPDDPADNAAVIRTVIPMVAGYRLATSNLPLPRELARSGDDSDADGVIDWEDHFPFDGSEQHDTDLDSTGDASDVYPLDAAEQADTDGDAIGNNADPDDDGDGVNDGADAFPLDAFESSDPDADGTGSNSDAFPNTASEFRDFDLDGSGNNEDPDDDNDGYPELDPVAQDLLVISTGNSRILRFDAANGAFRGVEVPPWDSLLTFQSSLTHRPSDHTLLYLGDSAVKRMDLLNRELLGVFVPAYDEDAENLQLGTGFPTGVATFDNGRRIAVSRLDETEIALFRGQNRVQSENIIDWSISIGESPIDIIGDGNSAIILGQANRTIYRATAPVMEFLSPPPTGWMLDPHRMTLSGDGRLLISDQLRNSVVAVDAIDGTFLGDLAQLGEHGYSNPTGVAVTRSGELLVAGADQDVILRFDAGSGAFLGELAGSGFGGLDRPHAMLLVPQLVDRFNADSERVIRPNPGLWFNQATSGRGFDIQVYGDRLSVIWYTYDSDGLPTWFFGAGDLVGFDFAAALLVFHMNGEGQTSFTEAGSITMSFDSERSAQVAWTIGEHSGSEPLRWIDFTHDVAQEDLTGLWGRADGPGWGISLAEQADITVAIAYLYDAAGQPRWVISDPFLGPAPLQLNMNASFSETLCPGCSGVSEFEFQPAGSMELVLPNGATWSSDVSFPAPMAGDWDLDQVPLFLFSDHPDRPR